MCFFLARYLAAPVDRLRLATRQMAAGDLNVRVLPALKGRQDDLGLLAADLDAMAERLRQLLESKQQLLRDVSHELRSPLARLQLALSLARREESDAERHLARIACEADRLEQLIARTLKLVRLERPAGRRSSTPEVDVGDLLRNIAADVAIEADARGCLVNVQARAGAHAVSGDPELLRSAFENVIRNAVRYSPAGAVVAVSARRMQRSRRAAGREPQDVEVTVRDHGPGVPDKDLGAHLRAVLPRRCGARAPQRGRGGPRAGDRRARRDAARRQHQGAQPPRRRAHRVDHAAGGGSGARARAAGGGRRGMTQVLRTRPPQINVG